MKSKEGTSENQNVSQNIAQSWCENDQIVLLLDRMMKVDGGTVS